MVIPYTQPDYHNQGRINRMKKLEAGKDYFCGTLKKKVRVVDAHILPMSYAHYSEDGAIGQYDHEPHTCVSYISEYTASEGKGKPKIVVKKKFVPVKSLSPWKEKTKDTKTK